MDDFFSYGSKAIIILPIFIVIVSLFLKFNQPIINSVNQNPKITPTAISTVKKSDFKFDLTGPYKCAFKNKEIDLTIYVKNKNISATMIKNKKTTKYLLQGDCLIIEDQKTCGVSKYISMAEGLLNSNPSLVSNLVSQKIGSDIDINEVLKTCKKEAIGEDVFKLP